MVGATQLSTCRPSNDHAVSPVVGTILMVAVTVAIGATVLAITSGIGDDGIQESTNAVFQATAVDTNANGKTDAIRVTYISGTAGLANADVAVSIRDGGGAALATSTSGTWSPGDFRLFDCAGAGCSSAGSWFTTVSVLDGTVVDKTLNVDE